MTSRRLFPRGILLASVLTAAAALILIAISAAAQSATGHIAGIVTDEVTGAPLSGMAVTIWGIPGDWRQRGAALTAADGAYDIGDLIPGAYQVTFADPRGDHIPETFDNAVYPAATYVYVTAGQTTAGINAALAGAGHITGRITAELTGAPVVGIRAAALRWDPAHGVWRWQLSLDSGADGSYDLGELPPGSYQVQFWDYTDRYVGETYDDVPNHGPGTVLTVSTGQTISEINAVLAELGRISGKVTDRVSGLPLAGVQVAIYQWYWGLQWNALTTTLTAADGTYDVGSFSAGTYVVHFADPDDRHAPQFYNGDSDNILDADKVFVATSRTTAGIDAALATWGHITGTVTAQATGAPLSGILVTLYDNPWWSGQQTTTDHNGTYDFSHLRTGAQRVQFADPDRRYQTIFYGDALHIEDAPTVSVTLGVTTAGVNIALTERGHITGTVIAGATGLPLAGIQVSFSPTTRWEDGLITVATDAAGAYDSGGLNADRYYVAFAAPDNRVAPQYYDHVSGSTGATLVAVTPTQTAAGVNAELLDWGRVTGRVTDRATGQPLAGIRVGLNHLEYHWRIRWYWEEVGATSTGRDGVYHFAGVIPDNYRVRITDPNGAYTSYFSSADIPVPLGEPVVGVNAALEKLVPLLGHITGTVTARTDAAPLTGIRVQVYYRSGSAWYWDYRYDAMSGPGGVYQIYNLSPGVYRVKFEDPAGRFESQFYAEAPSPDSGADVRVTADHATPNINATLVERGRITGQVIAQATGDPLPGITVGFWQGGDWWRSGATTDAAGRYNSGYLPAGAYRVWVSDPQNHYQFRVYPAANSIEAGADVLVTAEHTTAGIAVALAEKGRISGRVTAEATGEPISDIRVDAYLGGFWQASIVTDADGLYELTNLSDGAYRVQFVDPGNKYLIEVYADVIVAAPRVTANINAALAEVERNRITGTVTDQETAAPLPGIQVSFCWPGYPYCAGWGILRSVVTGADGRYDSGKLADAVYRIGFTDPGGHYQTEYYDNADAPAASARITVTGGLTRSGFDAALTVPPLAGHIIGTLTDRMTSAPAVAIPVRAYRWNGSWWQEQATVWSTADGSYDIAGLSAGSYRVGFLGERRYVNQFYDNATSLDLAAELRLTAGQVWGNINAVLTPWGQITGTVTDQRTGQPLAGIWVIPWYPEYYVAREWHQGVGTVTAADGSYTFGGLSAGIYRVEFYDPGGRYGSEFYDNATTFASSAIITFTVGQAISNVNAALAPRADLRTPTPTPQPNPHIRVYLPVVLNPYPPPATPQPSQRHYLPMIQR